jgi:hypothetical protein
MDPTQLIWGGRVSGGDLKELRSGAAALAITLLTLNMIDIFITDFNIARFGATELNSLFAPFIGTPWALILKIGIPVAIIDLAMGVRSVRALTALQTAVAIYMVVVIIGVGQAVYAVA